MSIAGSWREYIGDVEIGFWNAPFVGREGAFLSKSGVDAVVFFFQLKRDSNSNLKSYDKSYCETSDLSKIWVDWMFKIWPGLGDL